MIAMVIVSTCFRRKGDKNVLEASEEAQKPIGLSRKHLNFSGCMTRGTFVRIDELDTHSSEGGNCIIFALEKPMHPEMIFPENDTRVLRSNGRDEHYPLNTTGDRLGCQIHALRPRSSSTLTDGEVAEECLTEHVCPSEVLRVYAMARNSRVEDRACLGFCGRELSC